MGNHINEKGEFQSDLHPELPPDKIILSFQDPRAWSALMTGAINPDTRGLLPGFRPKSVEHEPLPGP